MTEVHSWEGPVVGLFDGQGELRPGSGQLVWEKHARAREIIDIGSQAIGVDLKRVLFEGGDLNLLARHAQIAQPATAVISVAECESWCERYERDLDVVSGLSIGLWSSLAKVGCVEGRNDDDKIFKTFELLAKRGRIVSEFNEENEKNGQGGGMAIHVGELLEHVPEPIKVAVSRYKMSILSGPKAALERFRIEHGLDEMRFKNLPIVGALHHPIQLPTQEPLRHELENVVTLDPTKKFMGNSVKDGYLETAEDVVNHLIEQLVSEAEFVDILRKLALDGVVYAIQFGPDKKKSLLRDAKSAGLSPISFPHSKTP